MFRDGGGRARREAEVRAVALRAGWAGDAGGRGLLPARVSAGASERDF